MLCIRRPFVTGRLTRKVDPGLLSQAKHIKEVAFLLEDTWLHGYLHARRVVHLSFLHCNLHHVGVRRNFQGGCGVYRHVGPTIVVKP